MSKMFYLVRACAAVALAATMAACTTNAPVVPAAPKLQDLLSQASQASAGGNKEQAIKLWKQSAVAFPAEKEPWSLIAQTRYESGQYGEAIAAAEEVLVRDPNDTQANSIIAVAGLRLSTRALGELSRQKHLTGSVRTESQELAKLLRANLNEEQLFTANDKPAVITPRDNKPPVNNTRATRRTGRAATTDDKPSTGSLLDVLNGK